MAAAHGAHEERLPQGTFAHQQQFAGLRQRTAIKRSPQSSRIPRWQQEPGLPPAPGGEEYTCDDTGECKVAACDAVQGCRTSLDVRIDDLWYDLSGWRKAHPGGEQWIDYYDGRDATEVMHAFHSEKGRSMLLRLPRSRNPEQLEAQCAPVTSLTRNFRKLRSRLEEEGWWKRDVGVEVRQLTVLASSFAAGLACVWAPGGRWPAKLVGVLILALSNTQAGWMAHDYIHGVDKLSDRLRFMGPLVAGMSPIWWSDKHNKHHALTNEIGVDEDIATDPFLYIKPPDPSQDSFLRKFQHWTIALPFSLLFVIWRVDSIKVLLQEIRKKRPRKRAMGELVLLVVHWAVVFATVPLHIIPLYLLLSGLITAMITTSTHQSEELFENFNPDFVENQFRTTRDAAVTNPFSKWVWGGMQYQLEHHLFPSMPRSNYPALQPILQKFAFVNKVPGGHRISTELELLKNNWKLYSEVASAAPIPGAPPMRGRGHHVTALA
ncbi:unnamed protein product [Polarella glacialis]|uniref:Cytochrome b5 heme-binding domain-containing protein n=1 Tax=Polarella glacialis TaxID=89957 RepID=A0A813HS81_POLGL|nr:unnamed protein product [Polarella glacialis]